MPELNEGWNEKEDQGTKWYPQILDILWHEAKKL